MVKASLEEAEKSMTEFSAERDVAAFKPSQASQIKILVKMSSCYCMLSGREIATNTGTNGINV